MWKEMDFYSKRDDDSAIGDSENNSAEEESTNSRRISDDIEEMPIEQYAGITSKMGKVPECLLKDSDESVELCRKFGKNSVSNAANPKREIRVLSSNLACTRTSNDRAKPHSKKQHNTTVLEAKLQHLFLEMKKLRELDHDILKKFSFLNESVEDMRWKIAENEKRLVEDGVDDDIMMTLSENRLNDWNDFEFSPTKESADVNFVSSPVTKAPTSYASLTYVKSTKSTNAATPSSGSGEGGEGVKASFKATESKRSSESSCENGSSDVTRSYSNPTYEKVDSKGKLTQSEDKPQSPPKVIEIEKLNQHNYYRFKSPHPSPSDVWVKREKANTITESSSSQRDVKPQQTQQRPTSASLVRKYSDRIEQQQQQQNRPRSKQTASSNRRGSEENSRVGRKTQWPIMEKRDEKKMPDFQKQRDYQNLIGLSRVSGRGQTFQPNRQKSFSKKPSDSTGSLTSSSSITSSGSTSPVSNEVTRSNSSKWGRFGLRRSSSKSFSMQTNNNNNVGGMVIVNNNYKPSSSHQRHHDAIPRDQNVIAVSYKRSSSDAVYNWIQTHQDDVTYL